MSEELSGNIKIEQFRHNYVGEQDNCTALCRCRENLKYEM